MLFQERSQKNKQNRSKNKLKHNTGSKAFVVIREEMVRSIIIYTFVIISFTIQIYRYIYIFI